ncbi:hypothetical protein EDB89DRAFT_1449003 [Lactarius sanguifluus]|nr:hypothetical protein EDB89DRAFT_1449003 [Lactarius sanguifluus]
MRSFAAFASLVLLAAGDFAAAQINAPDCSLSWKWTFNTLGQNACTVGAYMMATCNGGAFTIDALQPGYSYTGPSGIDNANLCKCNTVTYNLISACDACQGATWITWSEYSFNCTRTLTPSTFPNAVPSGTVVPQWALLDHTNENLWNATTAFVVGDTPEIQPGSLIGTGTAASGSVSSTTSTASRSGSSSRSGSTTSSSTSSSPFSSPTSSSRSKSNTAAIAGGVAGGVVAVAAVVGLLFFFLRRRPRPQAPSAAFVVDGATPPPSATQHMSQVHQVQMHSDDGTTYVPGTPITPMKFYDPSDPSTYPGYQSVPSTPDVHVPVAPYEGSLNGNTLANMQTARPQGYHGLPTV